MRSVTQTKLMKIIEGKEAEYMTQRFKKKRHNHKKYYQIFFECILPPQ